MWSLKSLLKIKLGADYVQVVLDRYQSAAKLMTVSAASVVTLWSYHWPIVRFFPPYCTCNPLLQPAKCGICRFSISQTYLMNIVWSLWLSAYAFSLFNIFPFICPFLQQKTQRGNKEGVWYQGLETLFSMQEYIQLSCSFKERDDGGNAMLWCYWDLQSYCPGVGFAPLSN